MVIYSIYIEFTCSVSLNLDGLRAAWRVDVARRWELSLRLRQFLQVVQMTGHCARLHWETGTGWLPLAPGDLSLHFIFPRKVFVITRDQLPSHLNHTML